MAPAATAAILKPGITLYIVRHGETDWNRDARYQGQRDIPINDTGRIQAKRQGQTLRAQSLPLAAMDFISSPLQRAVETMHIVRTELGLDPSGFRTDRGLRELNYGHWEGLYAAELPVNDPVGLAEKARQPFAWRPHGGESYEDLQARVTPWLGTLERDAIIVTHGGISRVVRGALYGIARDDIPFLESPQDRILIATAASYTWL